MRGGEHLRNNFTQRENGKNEKNEKTEKNRVMQLANVLVMGISVLVIGIFLIAAERPTVSEQEKRELAKFPEFSWDSYFSGEYCAAIMEYYNDTVPGRDSFKELAAAVRKNMGIASGGTVIYSPIQKVTEEPEQTPATVETVPPVTTENTVDTDASQSELPAVDTAATTTTAPETEETEATETTTRPPNAAAEGWITNGQIVTNVDGHFWAIALFGGGSGKNFASYVSQFAERLPDINVYAMVAPTAGAYYTPSNFDEYNASHQKSINGMYDAMDDSVTTVDCYSVLEQHMDEYIYLRSDHHWQPLGAYYAAQEFARVAGVPFETIDNMEKIDIEGYLGYLYGVTQDPNLLNDPDLFTYYKPQNEYECYYYDTAYNLTGQFPFFLSMSVSDSYSIFMGADNKIVRIDTDVDNDRVLAVVKDSYGNAEIPFYFNSFSKIYVLDMRYFDLSTEFFKEQGVTDLLFTCNTLSAVGENAEDLATILAR